MADITPTVPEGRQQIQGYGDGRFRVGGNVHEGSVIVFVDLILPWPVTSYEGITAETLQPVVDRAAELDLLIVGCGPRFRPPDASLRQRFMAAEIGLEMMDTGAACRTYNLLLADDRRVAVALIAVE